MTPKPLRFTILAALCATTVAGGALAESHRDPAKTAARPEAPAKVAAAGEKAKPQTDAAHDAMMAEMQKYAMPGPAHEWLKQAEGSWKATVKMWMGPGEPVVSQGTSENRLIMGGRYLEQRYRGTFMDQPFEGLGLLGYDNKKQQYFNFWIDNSSTGMMTANGGTDESGKLLTMLSMTDGPDGQPMETRAVTKVIDANSHVYSMYGKMGDQELLMMEITYTRAR